MILKDKYYMALKEIFGLGAVDFSSDEDAFVALIEKASEVEGVREKNEDLEFALVCMTEECRWWKSYSKWCRETE